MWARKLVDHIVWFYFDVKAFGGASRLFSIGNTRVPGFDKGLLFLVPLLSPVPQRASNISSLPSHLTRSRPPVSSTAFHPDGRHHAVARLSVLRHNGRSSTIHQPSRWLQLSHHVMSIWTEIPSWFQHNSSPRCRTNPRISFGGANCFCLRRHSPDTVTDTDILRPL